MPKTPRDAKFTNLTTDVVSALKNIPVVDESLINELNALAGKNNPVELCDDFEVEESKILIQVDPLTEKLSKSAKGDKKDKKSVIISGKLKKESIIQKKLNEVPIVVKKEECDPRFDSESVADKVAKTITELNPLISKTLSSAKEIRSKSDFVVPSPIDELNLNIKQTAISVVPEESEECDPRFVTDEIKSKLLTDQISQVSELAKKQLESTDSSGASSLNCEVGGMALIKEAVEQCKIDQNIASTELMGFHEQIKQFCFNLFLFEYYVYGIILYSKKFRFSDAESESLKGLIRKQISDIRYDIINRVPLDTEAREFRDIELAKVNRGISPIVSRSSSKNKFFSPISIVYDTFLLDKLDVYERDLSNIKFNSADLQEDALRLGISNNVDNHSLKDLVELLSTGQIVVTDNVVSFLSTEQFAVDPTNFAGSDLPVSSSGENQARPTGNNPASVILGAYDDNGNASANSENDVSNQQLFEQFVTTTNTLTNTILNTISNVLLDKFRTLASNADIEQISIPNLTSTPNVKENIVHDFDLDTFVSSGFVLDHINKATRRPTIPEASSGNFINILLDEIENDLKNNIFIKLNELNVQTISIARILNVVIRRHSDISSFVNKMEEVKSRILDSKNKLISTFEHNEIPYQKYQLIKRLKQIKVCDKPVIGDDLNLVVDDAPADDSLKSFPTEGQPTLIQLSYWKQWTKKMNVVALLPQHYPIGLVVTGASGVDRIPLPTVWQPIAIVNTPATILVIFVTVTGVVVAPAVWQLKMLPIADSDSCFFLLFRGQNVLIKANTKTESTNSAVVDGIDTDPDKTKKEAYVSDDLVISNRMTTTNLLWQNYLNQWCSVAKNYQGLP